jgi:hypothetical protein
MLIVIPAVMVVMNLAMFVSDARMDGMFRKILQRCASLAMLIVSPVSFQQPAVHPAITTLV